MNSHTNDTTAVSPVLAVILVLGVTVILSAAIGVLVLDIGQSQTSTNSQANTAFSISDDNGEVQIQARTGTAERVNVLVNGEVETSKEDVRPGDVITLDDISEDAVITVVEVVGDSESVRETHTVTDGVSEEVVGVSEPSASAPSDVSMVSFDSGNGTESNPYVIMNDQQLQAVSTDLSAHYVLGQNIDASGTSSWNSGSGFNPIGDIYNGFSGSINGNGYVITGLYIDRPSTNHVGLIGFSTGSVTDIGVTNVDVTGNDHIGGLVGENEGSVKSSYATGTVSGDNSIGGLVGENRESVTESFATSTVNGEYDVGGLVGKNKYDSVTSSYATGTVSGNDAIGGLIGNNNDGSVKSSYATGTVSGNSFVGGLVGDNTGSVTNSYWDVETSGRLHSTGGEYLTSSELTGNNSLTNLDGFDTSVWESSTEYPVLSSISTSVQPMSPNSNILTEYQQALVDAPGKGTESNPHEISSITQLQGADSHVEGHYILVQDIDASGTSSWNSGSGFNPIGDIYNEFSGSINGNGYVINGLYIDRPSTNHVGLIGFSTGSVTDIGVTNVDVTGNDHIGGLVGENEGSVKSSHATGTVSGDNSIGGLVGENRESVTESFATSTVNGEYDVGGLVGKNKYDSVTSSYATGTVSGNDAIGGLIGNNNDGSVKSSYATGTVSGNSFVGGLVGDNTGSVTNSYWDVESSNTSLSGGGTGLNTSEMTGSSAESNMGGFDFISTWSSGSSDEYPVLVWESE